MVYLVICPSVKLLTSHVGARSFGAPTLGEMLWAHLPVPSVYQQQNPGVLYENNMFLLTEEII